MSSRATAQAGVFVTAWLAAARAGTALPLAVTIDVDGTAVNVRPVTLRSACVVRPSAVVTAVTWPPATPDRSTLDLCWTASTSPPRIDTEAMPEGGADTALTVDPAASWLAPEARLLPAAPANRCVPSAR